MSGLACSDRLAESWERAMLIQLHDILRGEVFCHRAHFCLAHHVCLA